MMDTSDSGSLHSQVANYIREQLYSQEWSVGERIPSEHELARSLGVSRGTVQKGINTLVEEGLLYQVRGKGTFVTKPALRHSVGNSLLSIAESLRLQGIDFKTEVITQKVVPASRTSTEKLHVPISSPILLLRRVRTVDGEPIIFMESRLRLDLCPGLENCDFVNTTLFNAIEDLGSSPVGYAKIWYGARAAGIERGEILGCDEKAPVLNVNQVIYLENNEPIEWSSMWLPANKFVLYSVLQRM